MLMWTDLEFADGGMICLEMSIFVFVWCWVTKWLGTASFYTLICELCELHCGPVEDIGQIRVGLCVPALAELSEHL